MVSSGDLWGPRSGDPSFFVLVLDSSSGTVLYLLGDGRISIEKEPTWMPSFDPRIRNFYYRLVSAP